MLCCGTAAVALFAFGVPGVRAEVYEAGRYDDQILADNEHHTLKGGVEVSSEGKHGIWVTRNGSVTGEGTVSVTTTGSLKYGVSINEGTGRFDNLTVNAGSDAVDVRGESTTLTVGGLADLRSNATGLYMAYSSQVILNDLKIHSGEHGVILAQPNTGKPATKLVVNGTTNIVSDTSNGITIFNEALARFNGMTTLTAANGNGAYIQNGRVELTDVDVFSGKKGLYLWGPDAELYVSGKAHVESSGDVGVHVYKGTAILNDVFVESYNVALYANAGNASLTVQGLADVTSTASAGVYALAGGEVTLAGGGTVTTLADVGYGLYQGKDSAIAVTAPLSVRTYGEGAHAVYLVGEDASFTMHGGTLSVNGAEAVPLYAKDGGTFTFTDTIGIATVHDGVNALSPESANAAIVVENGVVLHTKGHQAHGLAFREGTDLDFAGSLSARTEGNGSYGLYASDAFRTFVFADGAFSTSGEGAHALYADGGFIAAGGRVHILTEGEGAHAVYADNGARIGLADARIETRGEGAHGLYATNGSSIAGQGLYTLAGGVVADGASSIALALAAGSSFSGYTEIRDPSSGIDLSLNDAVWYVTHASSVTSLELGNGAVVDLVPLPYGEALSVDTLTGEGGTFVMRANMANGSATVLTIDDDSGGNHSLVVLPDGRSQAAGTETTTLVRDIDGDRAAQFSLVGGSVDYGAWKYTLDSRDTDEGTEWFLVAHDEGGNNGDGNGNGGGNGGDGNGNGGNGGGSASNAGSASVNVFRATHYLNSAETQTLLQRMGDLRGGRDRTDVWARAYGGSLDIGKGSYSRGFDMNYGGFQIGADRRLSTSDAFSSQWGDVYVGAMVGYSRGRLGFGHKGKGYADSKTLGAYATWMLPNGWYADAVLKTMWLNSDIRARDSLGQRVRGDADRFGLSGSVEVGKRFRFAPVGQNGFYVEPQAQIGFTRFGGGTLHASNGLKLAADGYTIGQGRVGLLGGYEWSTPKGQYVVYAKVSHNSEFGDDLTITANDVAKIREDMNQNWVSYGIGVTMQIQDNQNLYLDVERASGDTFKQDWAVKAGWRMTF